MNLAVQRQRHPDVGRALVENDRRLGRPGARNDAGDPLVVLLLARAEAPVLTDHEHGSRLNLGRILGLEELGAICAQQSDVAVGGDDHFLAGRGPAGVEDDRVWRLEAQVEVRLRDTDRLVLERIVDACDVCPDADAVDPRTTAGDHELLLWADGADADAARRSMDHELPPEILSPGGSVPNLQPVSVRRTLRLARVAPRGVNMETAAAIDVP